MKPLVLALASTSLFACVADPGDDLTETQQDINGDTWTTVENTLSTVGLGAEFHGLAAAPDGTMWVVGERLEADGPPSDGGTTWFVRSSANGTSWSFSDDFRLSTIWSSRAQAVAVDNSGRIFVAGWAIDGSGFTHWITRRSLDNGSAWATVDDFSVSGDAEAYAITIDNDGNVLVGGGTASGGSAFWKTRRSTDHGATWSTVDSVNQGSSTLINAFAQGSCVANGKLYEVGVVDYLTEHGPQQWQVRRSTTGTSWVEAELLAPTGVSAQASGCGGLNTGTLLVAGMEVGSTSHWMIQRSVDGSHFSTVDDVTGSYASAEAVREAQAGTSYAVGYVGSKWHARRTKDDGQTWAESDDWSLSTNAAQAHAVRFSSVQSATFAAGVAYDANQVPHAVVRRLLESQAQ